MASEERTTPVLKVSHERLLERSEKLSAQQTQEARTDAAGEKAPMQEPREPSRSFTTESEVGRGRLTPPQLEWEKELRSCEKKLEKLIARWAGSTEYMDRVNSVCKNMEHASCRIIEQGSVKEELVSKMWRACHYRVIEKLRKFYKQAHSKTTVVKSSIEADLLSFLKDSKHYYCQVVELYQSLAQISWDDFTKGEVVYSTRNRKHKVKACVNSLHHCYLSLGDLNRYLEELRPNPDWSIPRHYYLKSRELVPKDGKPYNQLAVIAINAHRRFDAVYFYCRSYWVTNSFLSAHDSLVGLFAETMRKARDEEEKRAVPDSGKSPKKKNEVWFMPGREEVPVTESDELRRLETSELLRKLVNVFLVVVGRLFTKVGISYFDDTVKEFLTMLGIYLERIECGSSCCDAPKFVEMVAISISTLHYIIENTGDPHSQAVGLGMGLDFTFQYITHWLGSCHRILATHGVSSGSLTDALTKSLYTISTLMPSVRVWFYWVSTHQSLWKPLIQYNRSLNSHVREFFVEYCQVINLSQVVLPLRITPPASTSLSYSKFWEDKMLAGFSCLPSLSGFTFEETLAIPEFSQLTEEQLHFQCLSRLSLLQYESISKMDTSLSDILHYDTSTNSLSVVLEVPIEVLPDDDQQEVTVIDDKEKEEEREYKGEAEDVVSPLEEVTDNLGILQLKKEKDRLAQQLQKHQEHQETAASLLKEVTKNQTEIIVRPRYLVPDTNCFVDYLKYLKELLATGYFVIAVPLIVIAELEGLSKGIQEVNQVNQSLSVDQLSFSAVTFIKETMSKSTPNMKALTSQGNLLSLLSLTSEELRDKPSNDDVILSSCLKLHERIDSTPSSTPNTYSVVLLTDDRNLRVKSHASHMPVRSVQQFLRLM